MGWDYSDLSRLAKQNGGPAELLEKHAAYHFKKGAVSKNPLIAVSSIAALGIGIGGTTLYYKWKSKKAQITVTENEIQGVEDELIAGMEHAEEVETMQKNNPEEVTQFQIPENESSKDDLDVSN